MTMVLFKKSISKLIFTLVLYGCSGPGLIISGVINHNNTQLGKITYGNSKDSVFNNMSYGAIIISESFWPKKKSIILSPVGSDLILQEDKRYETWFFYSKYKKNDGKATRDETTPYVFLNNRFYGKGWNVYDSISKLK